MKGSISFHKQRKYWYVSWPHKGKIVKIYKYKDQRMFDKRLAQKLLSVMQSDWENQNRVPFRLEKYTKRAFTDAVEYLWEWFEAVSHTLSPATYKDYKNSIKNHLEPFFRECPVQLHEIQLDVLTRLLRHINRKGKGKLNVMYCLHACLDFAWRAQRIDQVPPFPKKREYGITEPVPEVITEDRQDAIIEAIAPENQPIFWWLKYHIRRPSEACALFRCDFDGIVFTIHRAFSNRTLVETTKTGAVHIIPCHSSFRPIMEKMPHFAVSPFFFCNPRGRLPGRHYTLDSLSDIWRRACNSVGENISLYMGTKHSRCSYYANVLGYSDAQIQAVTDHARIESVKRYRKTELATKQALLEGKILEFPTKFLQGERK